MQGWLRRALMAASVGSGVIATEVTACADEPPPPAEVPPAAAPAQRPPSTGVPQPPPDLRPLAREAPTPEGEWDGWQTLLCDAVFIASIPAAIAVGAHAWQIPAIIGVGTYLVGPPIIHVAHGRALIGLADFGLRVGFPVGGAIATGIPIAAVAAIGAGPYAALAVVFGLAAGGLVGTIPAMILDATLLAREKPARAPTASRAVPRPSFVPLVAPRAGTSGLDVGVGGTF